MQGKFATFINAGRSRSSIRMIDDGEPLWHNLNEEVTLLLINHS